MREAIPPLQYTSSWRFTIENISYNFSSYLELSLGLFNSAVHRQLSESLLKSDLRVYRLHNVLLERIYR
jgi:hypothetical protein